MQKSMSHGAVVFNEKKVQSSSHHPDQSHQTTENKTGTSINFSIKEMSLLAPEEDLIDNADSEKFNQFIWGSINHYEQIVIYSGELIIYK